MGDEVVVVRPGGPVCEDVNVMVPLQGALGLVPGLMGAWFGGRLAGSASGRGRGTEDDEPIPAIRELS
jgi:hypothetical protein